MSYAHAWNETRRLEALGIMLIDAALASRMSVLAPDSKPGRPKLYRTEAEKKRAYRERLAKKPFAQIEGPENKVTDFENSQKAHPVSA